MARKQAAAAAPENHERWIVSYADMVTLLWALFVVLYALSDSNPRKLLLVQESINQAFDVGILSGSANNSIVDGGGGLAPSIHEIQSHNLTDISKTLGEFARANNLEGKIQVRQEADQIIISLADNLLFSSASADLKPGSQDVLSVVAQVLNTLPNNLRIEGHTDNVPVNSPDFATNWELSSARATTVLRFLLDTGGLAADRLQGAHFADTRPLAENDTPEGRALNRRADIVIIYPTEAELREALTPVEVD